MDFVVERWFCAKSGVSGSLLLACFGCFVGEELDRYSACCQGADVDVEKDSRAVDGGGHDLWLIDLAMQVSIYNLGGWTLLSCKKYWRSSWALGRLHVNPISVVGENGRRRSINIEKS